MCALCSVCTPLPRYQCWWCHLKVVLFDDTGFFLCSISLFRHIFFHFFLLCWLFIRLVCFNTTIFDVFVFPLYNDFIYECALVDVWLSHATVVNCWMQCIYFCDRGDFSSNYAPPHIFSNIFSRFYLTSFHFINGFFLSSFFHQSHSFL